MTARRTAALILTAALTAGAAALAALWAPAIMAHEARDTAGYMLDIGFMNEPAYEQQPNGVELTVTPPAGSSGELDADLMVEVDYITPDSRIEPLVLRLGRYGDEHGEHGDGLRYTAEFVPSTPGDYTFRVFGTLDGNEVDETFESGPTTFSPVLEANVYPPLLTAREIQNTASSNATDVEELTESVRNLRVGLWATVAALGILIVSTGVTALAFLRVARQQREGR